VSSQVAEDPTEVVLPPEGRDWYPLARTRAFSVSQTGAAGSAMWSSLNRSPGATTTRLRCPDCSPYVLRPEEGSLRLPACPINTLGTSHWYRLCFSCAASSGPSHPRSVVEDREFYAGCGRARTLTTDGLSAWQHSSVRPPCALRALGRRRVPPRQPRARRGARVALASVGDAGRTLEELRGLGRGSLRVGASTIRRLHGAKWSRVRSRYPGVEVHLDSPTRRDVEDTSHQPRWTWLSWRV